MNTHWHGWFQDEALWQFVAGEPLRCTVFR